MQINSLFSTIKLPGGRRNENCTASETKSGVPCALGAGQRRMLFGVRCLADASPKTAEQCSAVSSLKAQLGLVWLLLVLFPWHLQLAAVGSGWDQHLYGQADLGDLSGCCVPGCETRGSFSRVCYFFLSVVLCLNNCFLLESE